MFLRIVLSDQIPDGLMTVYNDYTLDDLLTMNEALDIVEEVQKEAEAQEAKRNK